MTTTEKPDLARLPKYAAGVEIPVCGGTRAMSLRRGDWVIRPYAGTPRLMVVLGVETVEDKTYLDLAFYPHTNKVLPWRTYHELDALEFVQTYDGLVG